MKTKICRAVLLAAVIFLPVGGGLVRGDDATFVYQIVPVSLPRGHQVAGSITTNCNNCELGSANIIDYQISVSGPHHFVFMPILGETYAGPVGSIGEVLATPTQIIVPNTLDKRFWGLVFLEGNDCTNCMRQVDWSQQTVNFVESRVLYAVDITPPFFDHLHLPFEEIVVATLVPEPSGVVLVIAGGCAWVCCRYRRLSCRD
jgi:hypothetical protein